MKKQSVLGISIAICLSIVLPGAHGTVYERISTDGLMLRSDSIVFATLKDFSASQDGTSVVELTNIRVVADRSGVLGRGRATLRTTTAVRGDALSLSDHHINLIRDRRYLLFLRGGHDQAAPWIGFARPAYEIQNQVVTCPGGQIFGVGVYGLLCSTQEQQIGLPLTEEQLASQLTAFLSVARSRHPAEAQRFDSEAVMLDIVDGGVR